MLINDRTQTKESYQKADLNVHLAKKYVWHAHVERKVSERLFYVVFLIKIVHGLLIHLKPIKYFTVLQSGLANYFTESLRTIIVEVRSWSGSAIASLDWTDSDSFL